MTSNRPHARLRDALPPLPLSTLREGIGRMVLDAKGVRLGVEHPVVERQQGVLAEGDDQL